MNEYEWLIPTLFIIVVIELLIWLTGGYQDKTPNRMEIRKQSIIDCQSRGNDLSWCLEVIK